MLYNSTVVLRSEAIAEGARAGSALMNDPDNCDYYEEEEYNCSTDKLGIREVVVHYVLLCGISATTNGE
jgi:hypothetical protein